MTTTLLPNEQFAAEFVTNIGIDRAQNLLSKITERFERRYKKACNNSFSPVERGAIRVTEFEVELTHRIRIGLMLCDDSNNPEAARQRILERRLQRRLTRGLSR